MKRAAVYVLFGLLVYAAVLVAGFPADRAYALLQSRIPPRVHLYDLEGTVWNGRAGAAQMGNYRLSPVSWQYHPLGLLRGRMDVKLNIRRGPLRAEGVVGLYRSGALRLADTRVALPAAEISRAIGLPFIQVDGDLLARVEEARAARQRLTALTGKLLWNDAHVLKPQDAKLGALEADFTTGDDGIIKGRLHDNGGPLKLSGLITIKADGSYQVNADLSARDSSKPALNRLLDTLGRQGGPGGKVSLSYSGILPPI